jgi:hypothetical protein
MPGGANPVAVATEALGPYQAYVRRALTEGWAEPLFDGMVEMSEQWLAELDETREDAPFTELKVRATVRTAMALSIQILHRHVSRALGVDVSSQEGAHLLALAMLDVYSQPLITTQEAVSMRDALVKIHETQSGRGATLRTQEEHDHD